MADLTGVRTEAARRASIRELNDAFRQSFIGGRVLMTSGVNTLPSAEKAELLHRIRTFVDFNGENDPHGEHDFVNVVIDGQSYFAKIDYYALDMEGGSEDPANPEVTTRVLTIMRADEY